MLLKSRVRAIGAAVTSAAVLLTAAGAGWGNPAPGPIDRFNQQAVEDAYMQALAATTTVPLGWSGSEGTCDPGAISPAALASQLAVVNFQRAMIGVPAATLDAGLTDRAQKGAFAWTNGDACGMSAANYPGWKLHCVDTEMAIWDLLRLSRVYTVPHQIRIGVGLVPGGGAITHVQDSPEYNGPEWLEWPTSGYNPSPMVLGWNWHLSAPDADFSNATVTMSGADGAPLATPQILGATSPGEDRLGVGTLSWRPTNEDDEGAYTVTVNGIVRAGQTVSHTYTVNLFKPKPIIQGTPRFTGHLRVGSLVKALPVPVVPRPTLFDPGLSHNWPQLSWWRDGKRVRARGEYRLRVADQGHQLIVGERSTVNGFLNYLVFSGPTPVVQPATRLRPMAVRIDGKREVGSKVRAVPEWTFPRQRVRERFQWYRWQDPIPGADRPTFRLSKKYEGIDIGVRVRGRSGKQRATQLRTFLVNAR